MSDEPEPEVDVPQAGAARLASVRESGVFSSSLSVSELLLVRQAGYEPLGLVMGSSVYHVGIQLSGLGTTRELTTLTAAMYGARELAMRRMEAEARALDAHGVVAVHLRLSRHDLGEDVVEFVATGTAVRAAVVEGLPPARPFTSSLSGQDLYRLDAAGYAPLGLVLGTCVYHVANQGLGRLKRAGRNAELTAYTQARYDARELAMSRMQAEATALGAAGVVAVHLAQGEHVWRASQIEFVAIGTAVSRTSRAPAGPTAPTLVLGLDEASAAVQTTGL